MDEEPTESVDSDQPRYRLRSRPTAVSSSSSQVPITSHANLPAIDGCMAEGRSEEEATDASQGSSPPWEMPQLSPILEVEQDSQRTSSVISDTPPTLQPVTISAYAHVTTDTQTHSAWTVNSSHLQCAATQPTISTPTADAHTTPQTNRPTRPNPKITLTPLKMPPITQFTSLRSIRCMHSTNIFFLFGPKFLLFRPTNLILQSITLQLNECFPVGLIL